MYRVTPSLTVDNILKKITSYDIFRKYCLEFKEIGKAFHSPFRTDKHPSAFIIYYNGDLLFKDFITDATISIVLIFVAGIMITLSINELYPEAIKYKKTKQVTKGLIIGVILVLVNHFIF